MPKFFAKRINLIIKYKQITQKDLALILNVSHFTVSDWICKNKKPTNIKLTSYAKELGVNSKWLINGAGNIFTKEEAKKLISKELNSSNENKINSLLILLKEK